MIPAPGEEGEEREQCDAKTRIVCISLGHAEPAHSNPAYQTLLTNAVIWVSVRP